MARFHADRQTDARRMRRAFRATLTHLRAQAELEELRAMLAHFRMQAEIDTLRMSTEVLAIQDAMRTEAARAVASGRNERTTHAPH